MNNAKRERKRGGKEKKDNDRKEWKRERGNQLEKEKNDPQIRLDPQKRTPPPRE
jgi:hypothetical protein